MTDTASASVEMSAWERVQTARHAQRPHALEYIRGLCEDFVELHGDRRFGDDAAIIGGVASLQGRPVVVIGHQKGKDTRENLKRNFGMPKPEGYRKALRLFRYAEKFGMPLICFIDTPGAAPDRESEERGQANAIAECILTMADLRTPIVSVVIGEGGSGGALAIGVADRILMLENAIYSVVTPEGCASILWRDASKAPDAARAMRITAPDLLSLGIADQIVPEPAGGAHTDTVQAVESVSHAVSAALAAIIDTPIAELLEQRYAKYRAIGAFHTEQERMLTPQDGDTLPLIFS